MNEALHLSAEEEEDLINILLQIDKECRHIDKHTQEIILTHIETLLKYSHRFYERQFLTRKNNDTGLLAGLNNCLMSTSTVKDPKGCRYNRSLQG